MPSAILEDGRDGHTAKRSKIERQRAGSTARLFAPYRVRCSHTSVDQADMTDKYARQLV